MFLDQFPDKLIILGLHWNVQMLPTSYFAQPIILQEEEVQVVLVLPFRPLEK